MRKARRIEIDFHQVRMTMVEVITFVEQEKAAHPEREYLMDGDAYAIVSQERD